MPKKKIKRSTVVSLILIMAVCFAVAFAVGYKMSKDAVEDSSTTLNATAGDVIPVGTTDFSIENHNYVDLYDAAKKINVTDETDLKLICLNRFTMIEASEDNEPMLKQLEEGDGIWLWEEAADAFEKMYADASSAGVTLTPIDGYCGSDRQDRRYADKVNEFREDGQSSYEAQMNASYFVLPAGHSEQYFGLTVWVGLADESFKETDEYIWLRNHAADYGFIERYPSGKVDMTYINYAPYVWRYVGVDNANAMLQSGECLEEYVN